MTRLEYDSICEYLRANRYRDEGNDRFVTNKNGVRIEISAAIAVDGIHLETSMSLYKNVNLESCSMKIRRSTSSYSAFLDFLLEYETFVETFRKFSEHVLD